MSPSAVQHDRLSHPDSISPSICNIAAYLPRMAETVPNQPAIIVTRSRDRSGRAVYAQLTFAELEILTNRYANGLATARFHRGMRVLLMVRPGIEFVGLTFALFKLGVVPVLIDPGMGVGRMLECIRMVDLKGFIGIPPAHIMRLLRRRSFRSVKHVVTVGRRWGWGGSTLHSVSQSASPSFSMVNTAPEETAAILFTSGSTGPAKGVVYEHGMFGAQVRAIRSCYGMRPGEVDLPAFPLFALFSTAMGMTSVIPDMDASKPAQVNPARIVEAVRDHNVTSTFGSPAIWGRVASYCVERGITLPSLRRVLVAGAPVSYAVLAQLQEILAPDSNVHTPYGATESLPVSSITGREVLAECKEQSKRGSGTCVGRPLSGIELRIIKITDDPISVWTDDLVVSDGEIGEIVVAGDVVTKEYFGLPDATAGAKIVDGDRVRHRIGDVGYRDDRGRIWFCGRKAHRVMTASGTLYSVCCEAIFNEHPDVARSALVGVGTPGSKRPVVVVEPKAGRYPSGSRAEAFRAELGELGRAHDHTNKIEEFLFHKSLPVDVRHNAKINREELAHWAAGRLR